MYVYCNLNSIHGSIDIVLQEPNHPNDTALNCCAVGLMSPIYFIAQWNFLELWRLNISLDMVGESLSVDRH